MWWRYGRYEPTAYDDDWEDQPTQGGFYKWGLGVLLPLLFIHWGASALISHHTEYSGRGGSITLSGENAVAAGVAWLSVGLFLHCHYFWGNIYSQAWFAVLGKILGAVGFIAGTVFLLIRIGIFGINW